MGLIGNFKKGGGFSNLGKKLSGAGGRMMKVGGMVSKVGGFFDPRMAEIGDAISTAGSAVSGIGGISSQASELGNQLKARDIGRAGQSINSMVGGGRAVADTIRQGSNLKYS